VAIDFLGGLIGPLACLPLRVLFLLRLKFFPFVVELSFFPSQMHASPCAAALVPIALSRNNRTIFFFSEAFAGRVRHPCGQHFYLPADKYGDKRGGAFLRGSRQTCPSIRFAIFFPISLRVRQGTGLAMRRSSLSLVLRDRPLSFFFYKPH